MNQLDKVNENSLHLLLAVALLFLIVFSQSGGIISTYGQLSPGNSNTTTQLDSAQKSPDNGQSIATPGPSENDLGITNEQSKINNKENRDQPQILQQKQDKEEETSDNSDEVDGDHIPTNSEQDIEEKQGQKGQGDEEVKNNEDSKKENNEDSKKENNEDSKKENNEDIRLDWMPFP